MTVPTYVGAGTAAQSTSTSNLTSGTPTLPTGWAQNDIFILWISTRSTSLTLPGGWAAVPATTPQNSTFGTYSYFYWKRAGVSESNPTVTSTASDMYQLQVYAIRGCATSGTPFDNLAYTAVSSGTTSLVWPAVTTTASDEMIFMHLVGAAGASVGAVTNANLTSITEQFDLDSTNTFDHRALVTGGKATAGSTGTSTATLTASDTFIAVTIPIKSNSTATVSGSDASTNITDSASAAATAPGTDASGLTADTATVVSPVPAADASGLTAEAATVKVSATTEGAAWAEGTTIFANGATLVFATDASGQAVESTAPLAIKDTDTVTAPDVLQSAFAGIQGPLPPGPRIVRIGGSS